MTTGQKNGECCDKCRYCYGHEGLAHDHCGNSHCPCHTPAPTDDRGEACKCLERTQVGLPQHYPDCPLRGEAATAGEWRDEFYKEFAKKETNEWLMFATPLNLVGFISNLLTKAREETDKQWWPKKAQTIADIAREEGKAETIRLVREWAGKYPHLCGACQEKISNLSHSLACHMRSGLLRFLSEETGEKADTETNV